jgi:hypothetical protein
MDKEDFSSLVEKHFGFLVREYGFSIEYSKKVEPHNGLSHDDFDLVMQSTESRIRIATEMGTVIIDFAPAHIEKYSQIREWYDLSSIVSYLTQGPHQVNICLSYPEPVGDKSRIEKQFIRLNKVSKPYWPKILDMFRRDNFIEKEQDLDKFMKERAEKRWGKVSR